MIHSKNNIGFTLIEVLFALATLGMVLTPLILNQSNLLRRIAHQSKYLYRVYIAEQFMLDSYIKFEQDNSKRSVSKQIDDPKTTMNYRISDSSKSIKKLFRGIYAQEVTSEWQENGTTYNSKLITFLFLPELKK